MDTHNTSLASLGLASLVLAAVGWRACGDVSPSPAVGAPVRSAEPTSELRASAAASAHERSVAPDAAARTGLASDDPARVLAEIAEADRREGQVEARAALEVRALVSLERIGSAHAKLQHFAERYPHSPELPELVRLTGYHPRPPLQKPAH